MKPRKADMPEVDLLDFVRTCKRVAKQALGKHAGEPATGRFARWVYLVTHRKQTRNERLICWIDE